MKFENTRVWGFEGALRGMRNPKNSWNKADTKEYLWKDARGNPLFDEKEYNFCEYIGNDAKCVSIGPNDLKLAQALIKGGPEHRKFLRQIFVSVDITAPLYFFKEFDTYKIGTVANSTSTMHKLTSKPITRECFEIDDFDKDLSVQKVDQRGLTEEGKSLGFKAHWHIEDYVDYIIEHLEDIRQDYLHWQEASKKATDNPKLANYCKDVAYHLWKELVRWLPESWLQTRTVTMNYENLLSICNQRRFHKLNEWSGQNDSSLSNFIQWARTLPYAQEFIFIDELITEKEKMDKLISNLGISLQSSAGTRKTAEELTKEINAKILDLYS